MSVAWPTVAELRRIVGLDPDSSEFDGTLARQMAAGIALVKAQTGGWDEGTDLPDDGLAGAALRAAYLLSLKESPMAIIRDEVFKTYMHGHHRRFSFS